MKKRILSIVLTICMVVSMVSAIPTTAFAAYSDYTVTGYTALEGTAGFSGEGYENLVDGNSDTKWCTGNFTDGFIVFSAPSAVNVSGYTFTTANDNAQNTGRNPKSWVLYGCNDYTGTGTGTWTEIHSITDDTVLQDVNYTTFYYAFEKTAVAYQYFKLVISGTQGSDVMQMSEFALINCDHSWGETVTTEPTCDTEGITSKTCTLCNGTVIYDKVAAYGHNFDESGTCTVCGFVRLFNISEGNVRILNDDLNEGKIKVLYGSGEVARNIDPANEITVTGSTSNYELKIETEKPVTVRAKDLSIDSTGRSFAYALVLIGANDSADVTLILEGTNTFKGGQQKGGITAGEGKKLTITGDGSVTAIGGAYAAGIGAEVNSGCGTIIINSGTVVARGGVGGSGIGGGGVYSQAAGGSGGTVVITGGSVTATGDTNSSDIGGGYNNSGAGTVIITGGSVTANNNNIGGSSGIKPTDNENLEAFGDVTIPVDLTISANKTLTVPEGVTLTVPADVTLTNDGTIINNGTLTNNGTIINNGTITNNNAVTNEGTITNDGTVTSNGTVTNNGVINNLAVFDGTVSGEPVNDALRYVDEQGNEKFCTQWQLAEAGVTTWSDGWYVVKDNVTVDSRITVSGSVNLILMDGCTLTVNGGIKVDGENALTVYCQKEGTGKLIAQNVGMDKAGIGADSKGTCGTITINGGTVSAQGGLNSAGIGCGYLSTGGNITINGGTVIATGTFNRPGIGSGTSDASGIITINSGVVIANGNGVNGIVGNTTINGGIVFKNGEGNTYSDQALNADITVSEGKTLTVGEGFTVTVPENITLTNNGTINIDGTLINNGTIKNNGTINDNGAVTNNGTIQNNGTINNNGAVNNNGTVTGNYFTVSFDLNGGDGSAPEQFFFSNGSGTVTKPVAPTREGYLFKGWFNGDTQYDFSQVVTQSITLTARWVSENVSTEAEMKEVIAMGGTFVRMVADFKLSGKLDLSDKIMTLDLNGHTLTGDIQLADSSAAPKSILTLIDSNPTGGGVVKGNITLTRGNGSASHLYANGGTVTGQTSMPSYAGGIFCTSDTPTAFKGYVGNYGEIHGGMFYSNINESCIKEKTVTFMNGSSRYALQVVAAGNKVVAPIAPTKAGYAFAGWYNGETEYTFGSTISENITLTAKWRDITAPTGEISIGTNKWTEFFNNVTFGLFFKDTQNVTVTASDNSGEDVTIEYLLSDKELSSEELNTTSFTAYSEAFGISPDNKYVVYVKLTDTSGNVTYINSNGIVLDGTAPVISGIENGLSYCSSQTVTVTDEYIESVTVNGVNVTLDENNQFILTVAEGNQTVVATDKAGNTAEITAIVSDAHTYVWQSAEGQYWQKCEVCGYETAKKDIPVITVEGADVVCLTQDYEFGFTLPEGVYGVEYAYEFANVGDGGFPITTENGKMYGSIPSEYYAKDESGFDLVIYAYTSDGFLFVTRKRVSLLSEHNYAVSDTLVEHPHTVTYVCGVCGAQKKVDGTSDTCNACIFNLTKLSDGTYEVSAYNKTEVSVNIPSEFNGTPITKIGEACFKDNNNIQDVVIPEGVTSIGSLAFMNCRYLFLKVRIPASVTSIGTYAFYGFEGTIYCTKGSYAYEYAVANNIRYILTDGVESEELIYAQNGTTVDSIMKTIYTTVEGCNDIKKIIGVSDYAEIVINPSYSYGDTQYYGTGTVITVFEKGKYDRDYTLIVAGDVNGDSVCDVLDASQVSSAFTGLTTLSGVYLTAADSNSNDRIDAEDYQSVVNRMMQ